MGAGKEERGRPDGLGVEVVPSNSGVCFWVQVSPRAARNRILGVQAGVLRVAVAAPPVDGAANRVCVEFLAELLGVGRRQVSISAGGRARKKRILVAGVSRERVCEALRKVLARG